MGDAVLSRPQSLALEGLLRALQAATDTGLLDKLQPCCNEADSINDVCESATALWAAAAGVSTL